MSSGLRGLTGLLAPLLMTMAAVTTVSTPTAAQAATGDSILATYHDVDGRTVYYRNGTYDGRTGFGWQKVSQRHNISSYNAIGFIAHNPDGGQAQGSDRLYMAYANRKECTASFCEVTDSIPVKLVVSYAHVESYYEVTINGVLGVKTAYCVNDDRANDCPSWVDIALRDSFSSAAADDHVRVSTEWTYAPMAAGPTGE